MLHGTEANDAAQTNDATIPYRTVQPCSIIFYFFICPYFYFCDDLSLSSPDSLSNQKHSHFSLIVTWFWCVDLCLLCVCVCLSVVVSVSVSASFCPLSSPHLFPFPPSLPLAYGVRWKRYTRATSHSASFP
jgi:hypothetical protein